MIWWSTVLLLAYVYLVINDPGASARQMVDIVAEALFKGDSACASVRQMWLCVQSNGVLEVWLCCNVQQCKQLLIVGNWPLYRWVTLV